MFWCNSIYYDLKNSYHSIRNIPIKSYLSVHLTVGVVAQAGLLVYEKLRDVWLSCPTHPGGSYRSCLGAHCVRHHGLMGAPVTLGDQDMFKVNT